MDSTQCVRLLFDECIGENVARALVKVLAFNKNEQIDAVYMKSWLREGVKDTEWVPTARREGRFVITTDCGKRNDGAPLNLLLPKHGVSGAFITPTIHGRNQADKARAVMAVWPHIAIATRGIKGVRYKIRINSKIGDEIQSFGWFDWPLSERDDEKIKESTGRFRERLPFPNRSQIQNPQC